MDKRDLPQQHAVHDQRQLDAAGVLSYNARYYDPVLGRFISPDPIVPNGTSGNLDDVRHRALTVGFFNPRFIAALNNENQMLFWFEMSGKQKQQAGSPWGPANPQSLNRYSYVLNNPLKFVDPTGHYGTTHRYIKHNWEADIIRERLADAHRDQSYMLNAAGVILGVPAGVAAAHLLPIGGIGLAMGTGFIAILPEGVSLMTQRNVDIAYDEFLENLTSFTSIAEERGWNVKFTFSSGGRNSFNAKMELIGENGAVVQRYVINNSLVALSVADATRNLNSDPPFTTTLPQVQR